MDSCARRRRGDAFGVTFLGFETPMVMVSDPEAIQALCWGRENGLPRAAATLEPVLGPRSVLLLEGAEHLARRRLMLPPFHGERMRAYERIITELAAREIDTWPAGEAFPIHPRMQALTLEVILRAVFGVSDAARVARLQSLLGDLLAETSSPPSAGRSWRRFGGPDPLVGLNRRHGRGGRVAGRRGRPGRRADPRARKPGGHPVAAGRRPLRGRRALAQATPSCGTSS